MNFLSKTELLFLAGLVATIFLTVLIYLPGLSGPFVLDDFFNLGPLTEIEGDLTFDSARQFVFGNISGPTGRPASMISFLLHVQDWPDNPFPIKFTNLLLHIACTLTFCWIAVLLTRLLELNKK